MKKQFAQKILSKVVQDYSEIAGEFDRTRQSDWREFEDFLPYIKDDDKVLDLGCGNGRFFQFLSKHHKTSYLGVDNNEELLSAARKNNPKAKFQIGSMQDIPAKDHTFDVIANIAAFHHLPGRELKNAGLQEMRRVLKPNATLIITVWNLFQPRYKKYVRQAKLRSIFTKYETRDTLIPWGKTAKRYYYAFTKNELRNYLEANGFQILEMEVDRNIVAICKKATFPSTSILGVSINNLTLEEAEKYAHKASKSNKQHFITTPNPEILLAARKDKEFQKILNESDLRIPDGAGLLWAAKRKKTPLKERVTGTDLMIQICRTSDQKIFLLGAAPGVAAKAKEKLQKLNPKIKIVGTHSGSPEQKDEQEIITLINEAKPAILFVAYGAPNQEKWIAKNLEKLPSVRLAIGIGGAFDFIAGKRKRAPQWMQKIGLEWLYRLIQEPRRIKRIFNATIKFPLVFLTDHTINR